MTYRLLIEERAVEELKSLPPKIRERIIVRDITF